MQETPPIDLHLNRRLGFGKPHVSQALCQLRILDPGANHLRSEMALTGSAIRRRRRGTFIAA